ncbi:MAG: AAA family ATPase, partial [Kiritimatiellae bacterium]|nr:AAA family ATPase [Kiritimatiellia bacterium]
MKPIAVTISDFPTLIGRGQIYVDKTAYFHSLIADPNRTYYFIARPRRFGKTLMMSTFKAIFEGRRELF